MPDAMDRPAARSDRPWVSFLTRSFSMASTVQRLFGNRLVRTGHTPDFQQRKPARVPLDNLKLQSGWMTYNFAAPRHAPGHSTDKPAKRINLVTVICFQKLPSQILELLNLRRASARTLPSSLKIICGCTVWSCSSSISPTISSTRSSMVISPSTPPNSSTTSARWRRRSRI